jgi:hypothetical protein
MTDSAGLPHLVPKGVVFRLHVDSREMECLVSREALESLNGLKDTNPDPLEVFYAFQPAINAAARRLAMDGSSESPLVLGADALIDRRTQRRQA